jgi:hypothetical protein
MIDSFFSEQVEFEVPMIGPAGRLASRLGLVWMTGLERFDDSVLVTVNLGSHPQALARVLRMAEAWLDDESLRAIRYSVDGRTYILEAGELDLYWGLEPVPGSANPSSGPLGQIRPTEPEQPGETTGV